MVAPFFLLVFMGSTVFGVASILFGGGSSESPDLGRRNETAFELPDDVRLPVLVDATAAWGLEERVLVDDVGASAGGLAVGDLDRDGDLDLVVTHGRVQLYLWDGTRFGEPQTLADAAMSSTVFDVDLDGWLDVLVARDGATDLVVWGGPWVAGEEPPQEVTPLAGAAPTSLLLAGELSGDGQIDLVRLGRGTERGVRDIVWEANPESPREFSEVALGDDSRISLAGELVDADDDGMLDVYVSDLGDNEVLVRHDQQFEQVAETGAARISPPGAPATTISSSWASGATDANLDGRLDLVVVNGGFADGGMRNKIPGTEIAVADPPAILLGIGEGRFVDIWPRMDLAPDTSNRGLTIADIDADGDDDYLILSDDGAVHAIENTTGGHSPSVIAGLGDGDATISVKWANGTITTLALEAGVERSALAADC